MSSWPTIPKFSVTLAYSVQCYADLEIEATDLDDAISKISWSDAVPEYDTADEHRIVEILDEDNQTVAEAIYINP
jgi:hypothetical protein